MRGLPVMLLLVNASIVAAQPAAGEAERAREAAAKARLEVMESQKIDAQALLETAESLEREGRNPEAVEAYGKAARMGSGKAARRLGEIYARGLRDVPPDREQMLRWNTVARSLGEPLAPGAESRDPGYLRREPYRGGPPGDEAMRKTR